MILPVGLVQEGPQEENALLMAKESPSVTSCAVEEVGMLERKWLTSHAIVRYENLVVFSCVLEGVDKKKQPFNVLPQSVAVTSCYYYT